MVRYYFIIILFVLLNSLYCVQLWASEDGDSDDEERRERTQTELQHVNYQIGVYGRKLGGVGRSGKSNPFSKKNGYTYVNENGFAVYQNLASKYNQCTPGVSIEGIELGVAAPARRFHLDSPIFMEDVMEITFSSKEIEKVIDGVPVNNIGYQLAIFHESDGREVRLFFQTEADRLEARSILAKLRDLCHQRKSLLQSMAPAMVIAPLAPPVPVPVAEGKHIPSARQEVPKRTYPVIKIPPIDPSLLQNAPSQIAPLQISPVQVALLNGKESFAMRFRSLEEYQGPIRIQTLYWGGDEAGVELAERVIRLRREEGRDIKVFIDTLSPFVDIRDPVRKCDTIWMYYRMMVAGIPVYGFDCKHGLKKPFLQEEYENYLIAKKRVNLDDTNPNNDHIYTNWRSKMHEKIWTVGDDFAIIGGMNILNDYFQLAPEGKNYWRDQDIVTLGAPVVSELKEVVEQNIEDYLSYQDDPKTMPCYNSYPPGSREYEEFWQRETDQSNMDGTYHLYSCETEYKFGYKNPREALTTFALNELDRLKQGKIIEIVNGDTREEQERTFAPIFFPVEEYRVIPNRPRLGDLYVEDAYVRLLDEAQHEVWIANSYFIPPQPIMEAIKRAARRGVKINIIANSDNNNDLPIMTPNQRYLYKELLDENRGIEDVRISIYEFTGKEHGDGRQRRGMYHAKHMIVDREIYLVGSYNLDNVSRVMNSEVVQIIKSSPLAESSLERILREDLGYCRKISYRDALYYNSPISTKERAVLKISNMLQAHF
ncbi:MAG: hypothetical protein HQK53_05000 [Oligoflexia bacterium]|nr:hypothetical protein [Oligoflexia bacterium]